jgi:signal transduction histidine kinase
LAANQLDAFRAPIRIEDIAKDVINEYQPALTSRNLTLETAGDAWAQVLMADTTLLRMMLGNLLSNAIKYTPDGRKIILDICREGDKLHITVRDQGVGIAPDTMQLLFKPFFTTIDVSRGRTSKTQFMGMGMGMGLTIITKIVEVHKGQIWAESTGFDEKTLPGSAFHVLLPITES